MAMISTTVYAATTEQPAVEATKYPKSLQMRILESKDDTELKRAMEVVKSLKDNTAKVDAYGVAWKLADSKDIAKVRVTSGKIQFEWTPIYRGYTWISDLSMWSEGKLPGREALLEFLDKDGKVIWSTTVVLPKDVKVPEVGKQTGKEEIVPPCPMAPTSAPAEVVQIGVAPGDNK